jgi:hypothetical protein
VILSRTPRHRATPPAPLPEITTTRDLSRPGTHFVTCTACRSPLGEVHREITIDDDDVRHEDYRPILQPSTTEPSRVSGHPPTQTSREAASQTLRAAHRCPVHPTKSETTDA